MTALLNCAASDNSLDSRGNDTKKTSNPIVFVIPAKAGIQVILKRNMGKQFYVYLMASKRNGSLYIGVTSDLIKRVWEHKNGFVEGFTQKYNIKMLVYYEIHENAETAITREKRIKKWNRSWKLQLIEEKNPEWRDLYIDIC